VHARAKFRTNLLGFPVPYPYGICRAGGVGRVLCSAIGDIKHIDLHPRSRSCQKGAACAYRLVVLMRSYHKHGADLLDGEWKRRELLAEELRSQYAHGQVYVRDIVPPSDQKPVRASLGAGRQQLLNQGV
jgi:hypothetical protein